MRTRLAGPRSGGLLGLVLVVAVLPAFLPNAFYYDIVILAGLNAIVCVGLNLLIGYAGQISLGHAAFLGFGAYASAILTTHFGWHPVAAMAAGAVGAGVLAFVVARPILRLRGHYLAMATLGLGIIFTIVVTTEARYTGGPDGMTVPPLTVFGDPLYGEQAWYWIVGAALVVSVWLALNLVESPVGRALRAVHGSEPAAEIAGVDTTHYKVLVFVISAMFASLAGSLGAHYSGFLTPANVGFFRSIELVTMVVLGGMASTYGAVIGAVLLTALPQVLTGLEDYEHIAYGLILMLTVIFMPRGLVPSLVAAVQSRLRPAAEAPP